MVYGRERLKPRLYTWNDGQLRSATLKICKPHQHLCGQQRQVNGKNQIPIGGGMTQRCMNAGQWSDPGFLVGENGNRKVVCLDPPHDVDVASDTCHSVDGVS